MAVRTLSDEDVARRRQAIEPPKAVPVPSSESLVRALVTALQSVKIDVPAANVTIPAAPRPAYLEADIQRDKQGRMTRVIIVPIYEE